MLYRIRLDLAFTDRDPAQDILDKARDHIDEAVIINPGQPNEEKGFLDMEECYHDQDGTPHCLSLFHQVPP